MPELKALCMKCRQDGKEHQMQVMTDIKIEEKEGKGGNMRYSAKGKCSRCGGNMFKFLSKETAEQFKN